MEFFLQKTFIKQSITVSRNKLPNLCKTNFRNFYGKPFKKNIETVIRKYRHFVSSGQRVICENTIQLFLWEALLVKFTRIILRTVRSSHTKQLSKIHITSYTKKCFSYSKTWSYMIWLWTTNLNFISSH